MSNLTMAMEAKLDLNPATIEAIQDLIQANYSTAGNPLNDVLSKQYASVKDEHDQMCALRKSYKRKDASQLIASRTRHRKNSN
jgi:hypothetical protein